MDTGYGAKLYIMQVSDDGAVLYQDYIEKMTNPMIQLRVKNDNFIFSAKCRKYANLIPKSTNLNENTQNRFF